MAREKLCRIDNNLFILLLIAADFGGTSLGGVPISPSLDTAVRGVSRQVSGDIFGIYDVVDKAFPVHIPRRLQAIHNGNDNNAIKVLDSSARQNEVATVNGLSNYTANNTSYVGLLQGMMQSHGSVLWLNTGEGYDVVSPGALQNVTHDITYTGQALLTVTGCFHFVTYFR